MKRLLKACARRITGWEISQFGHHSFALIDEHHSSDAWFSYRTQLRWILEAEHIDLVVDVVMRPVLDAEKPRVYAMGQMLLPKVQAYLPEKAALLQGTLQYLNIGLSPQVTDPASYARLGQSSDQRDEEELKYIESLSDDGQRDALYTSHVRGHILMAHGPDHAREIAGKVKDGDLRRSLLVYMDFADAVRLLEGKRTVDALDIAGRMPPGIERCLLRLSAASAIGKADHKAAFALVTAALEDARNRLKKRLEGLNARTDLDAQARQILVRNLEETENRQLRVLERRIAEARDAKIRASRETMEGEIRSIRTRIRTLAVLLPPVPVLLIGAAVFVRRTRRERDAARAAGRLRDVA